MGEREAVHGSAIALLDGTDDAFGLRDVFICGSNVEVGAKVFEEGVTETLEFVIGMYHVDFETACLVDVIGLLEAGEDILEDRAARNVFHREELQTTRDGAQKNEAVNKEMARPRDGFQYTL